MNSSVSGTIRKLNILIIVLCGTLFSSSLVAVDCTSDYIELNTQSRINSFQSDYGGGGTCDTVPGTLRIGGPDVVDLTPLSALITIRDQFQIRQTKNLTDLDGLSALTSVGGEKNDAAGSFYIIDNEALTSLNGLTGMVSIGGELYISDNPALTSLDGMSALSSVHSLGISNNDALTDISGISAVTDGIFGGSISINGNDALTNLDALSSLTSVDDLRITHNYALTNLDGMSSVTFVGQTLDIRGNSVLTDINGLSLLHGVGGTLQLIANNSLTAIDGLSALASVLVLNIRLNESLTNLDGLSGLHSILGGLQIDQNPVLVNCQGLVTLVDPIDDHDPGPGASGIPDIAGTAVIQSNGDGCSSVSDILGQAPLSEINAGLNDAWFNLETNGQGFLVTVFPEIKQIFMAWFTYDTERPPEEVTAILGEPGHRWLTAQGEYVDNIADLTLYVTAGGEFDSEEPMPGTEPYGEILLEFRTCNSGVVTYDIPSVFLMGSIPIERIVLDNVSLCYVLEQQALSANAVSE